MAESGVEGRPITSEKVSAWTEDLSSLILVQRARVLTLKSPAEIEEAEVKLASLESLLRVAIIAHQAEMKKHEDKTTRQKLEQLRSRLKEAIIDQGSRVRKLEGKSEHEEAVRRLESLKADYKEATGNEWSEWRAEGPILLTTNSVRGREILPELRERLRELRRKGIIGYNIQYFIFNCICIMTILYSENTRRYW